MIRNCQLGLFEVVGSNDCYLLHLGSISASDMFSSYCVYCCNGFKHYCRRTLSPKEYFTFGLKIGLLSYMEKTEMSINNVNSKLKMSTKHQAHEKYSNMWIGTQECTKYQLSLAYKRLNKGPFSIPPITTIVTI